MEENKLVKKEKPKKGSIKKYIIPIIIISLIILIDQITKLVCVNMGNTTIIENVLSIGVYENTNPAYGIGNSSTAMFVITNLIIILVLAKFITSQNEFITTKMKIFLSLIIAGGISNTLDRLFRGYVLEFVDLSHINLPIFNLADVSVLIGWVGFVAIFAAFTVKELRNNKQDKEVKKTVLEDKDKKKIKEEKDKNNKEN